jgi:nucleoside-diphosphate-sugar epimerase
MKVMITGAGGFIGSHLLKSFANEDVELITIDTKDFGDWKYFDIRDPVGIERHAIADGFDMIDADALTKLMAKEKPDIIYHFAGLPIPKLYIHDPRKVIRSNLYSTENLLGAIDYINETGDYKPFIVFSSSSEVYGDSDSYVENESSSVYPAFGISRRWCYAKSKAMSEELLAASGYEWMAMRLFNIVGAEIDSWNDGRVLTKMIGSAFANGYLEVTDGGGQVRAFTHVTDFIRAMKEIYYRFVQRESEEVRMNLDGVWNFGNVTNAKNIGQVADIIVETIHEKSGLIVDVKQVTAEEFYEGKFSDIHWRVPDMHKWNKMFTTRAKVPFKYIIDEMVIAAMGFYKQQLDDMKSQTLERKTEDE